MNKIAIKITVVLIIGLSASISHAYMFNDVIGDRIGDIIFEIYGMNVTQTGSDIIFDIFTNYRESGFGVSGWYTLPADFAIDVDGDSKYEYGVAFRNHGSGDNPLINKGDLYNVDITENQTGYGIINGWYISDHYDPRDRRYVYNHQKPVGIAGGTYLKNISVNWNSIGNNPNWQISFTLDKNDFLPPDYYGTFNFFTASATCANDYMDGTVKVIPEPTSMLLFSIGALGFVGKRGRIKKGQVTSIRFTN